MRNYTVKAIIMKNSGRVLQSILGLCITGTIFYYLGTHIVFNDLIFAIEQIKIGSVIVSAILFILSCVFRALLWRIIIQNIEIVSYSRLFGIIMVGYLANSLLPLRSGDILRAAYLSRKSEIPLPVSLSTVCVERVLDVIMVGLLFVYVACLYSVDFLPDKASYVLLLTVFIISGILAYRFQKKIIQLILFFVRKTSWQDSISIWMQYLSVLISSVRQTKTVIALFASCLAAWICNLLSLWVLLIDNKELGMHAAMLLLFYINVGLLIPAAPGGLGTMQAAFVFALAPFQIAMADALALSFVYHGSLYISIWGIGSIYFMTDCLPFMRRLKATA